MIDRNSEVVRSTKPLATEIDGEAVLMDVDSGSYFNLDAVGTAVWNRLADPVRVDALCAALAQDYDAPDDVIERDVLAFLTRLHDNRLIALR